MLDMLAAELMKVRTRWMPYAIFLFLVLGAAMQIWLFGSVAYLDERGNPEFGGEMPPSFFTFRLPWALNALLDSGQFWGGVFVAFLASSIVATEHNWGTVRQAIVRGQTRTQYFMTKLLSVSLVASVMMLAAFVIGVVFSIAATALQGEPVTLAVPGGPSAGEVPVMVLRAGLGVLPYGMLAFGLTVVGRSTALGATGTLIYKLAETIVLPIFTELGGVWADLRVLFIGHFADALIAANRIDSNEYNSIAFRNLPVASELPDPWVAAIMLLAYSALFGALALFVFQRRDLNTRAE